MSEGGFTPQKKKKKNPRGTEQRNKCKGLEVHHLLCCVGESSVDTDVKYGKEYRTIPQFVLKKETCYLI